MNDREQFEAWAKDNWMYIDVKENAAVIWQAGAESKQSELDVLKQELQALREQKPVAWQLIDHTNYLPQFTIYPNKPPVNFSRQLYAAPVPASEGWKLVPIEPTDEMMKAFIDSPDMATWQDDFISGYTAMLAAAPKEQA